MKRRILGFTLVELFFVIAVVGALLAISLPAFERYLAQSRVIETKTAISEMQKTIRDYEIAKGVLPDDLADVGYASKLDPWGRPYEYLNLRTAKGNGQARKDKVLKPLNSDFDLYSVGVDGLTAANLNNAAARDDVVRARDGRFVGLAEEFDP
jgi:general secretion pathway protein G